MKNQISFNQKLDLLIISLKTLEASTNNRLIKTTKTKSINNLNKYLTHLDKLYMYLKKYNRILYTYLVTIILNLYILHKNIHNYLLSKNANLVLKSYTNYKESKKLKQYIRKFNYLYFKRYEYYNNYKYINYTSKIEINKIAITNLYLITTIINKQGIYVLIKYLIK
uniref:hypothetical protein n=1 Tax=Laurencia catarinensis TaxID=197326 RepID=UPI0028D39BCB|nr:hypothetical protein RU987_pgp008 [Laurencia catarinensis]WMP12572.1 hypothetical protein [Laurencia catarinensis]